MLNNLLLIGTLIGTASTVDAVNARVSCDPVKGDIYQFSATLLDGSAKIDFEEYRGKVLYIYNIQLFT